MNKALIKYGKVSFKSIIPSRLRNARAIRTANAAQISTHGATQVNAIASSQCGDAFLIAKKIAIAESILKTQSSISKCLTRKDHPIHFEGK